MALALVRTILLDGLKKGALSLTRLARFVLPTVFLLTLLQHSSLFPRLAEWLSPLTAGLGLPGHAALLLLTGLLINKFAGIAGLLVLPLNKAQFFTAAVFLALAHNLIMELLIGWQSRLNVMALALVRTGVAYVAAMAVHVVLAWTGWLGTQPLHGALVVGGATAAGSILWSAVWQAVRTMLMIAMYLMPLFLFLETLKQLHWMERLETLAAPLTRALRLSPGLANALLSGLFLGVATGAGVIEQSLREMEPSRKELWRLNVFLLLFHSLFEDTLMFALFPVPVLAVAGVRFAFAWVACLLVV